MKLSIFFQDILACFNLKTKNPVTETYRGRKSTCRFYPTQQWYIVSNDICLNCYEFSPWLVRGIDKNWRRSMQDGRLVMSAICKLLHNSFFLVIALFSTIIIIWPRFQMFSGAIEINKTSTHHVSFKIDVFPMFFWPLFPIFQNSLKRRKCQS